MIRRHFVHAGEVFVSSEDIVISTILGPCVAVSVYDREAGLAGLTHFALPRPTENPENLLRYGAFAVPALLREMIRAGAVLARFETRIFGGASIHGITPEPTIGTRNVAIAEEELAKMHLAPRERHVLGTRPRKVTFEIKTGIASAVFVGAGS
ncbi:MAG: chemotaxis protein CheD [Polyangiaceae bacterium]|nr:chemotaxis protein CheD [Polyangiaceae bacterium]